MNQATPLLRNVRCADLREALAGSGVRIDLGAFAVRVRTRLPELAPQLQAVYPEFPFDVRVDDVDTSLEVRAETGVRRWFGPLARIEVDGIDPFGPFPRNQALPHFEWGVNWACASMMNAHLLLHSGAVEISGCGVLLVASPGSGKSTLTAALVGRGARLLSDEFGVVRVADGGLLPMAKPIALKNRSVDVIRAWSPSASFGPVFANTRKGNLAHLAAPPESVASVGTPARPGVVLFPTWRAGSALSILPVATARAFIELAGNSFNYETMGAVGFDAVAAMLSRCRCYRLEYGDLPTCVEAIGRLCAEPSVERGQEPFTGPVS